MTSKCDLDLGTTELGLAIKKLRHDGQHFCQVISKFIKEWQSSGPDMKKRPYFLPLTSKCDLDIGATDIGLAGDTSSHDGQYFC